VSARGTTTVAPNPAARDGPFSLGRSPQGDRSPAIAGFGRHTTYHLDSMRGRSRRLRGSGRRKLTDHGVGVRDCTASSGQRLGGRCSGDQFGVVFRLVLERQQRAKLPGAAPCFSRAGSLDVARCACVLAYPSCAEKNTGDGVGGSDPCVYTRSDRRSVVLSLVRVFSCLEPFHCLAQVCPAVVGCAWAGVATSLDHGLVMSSGSSPTSEMPSVLMLRHSLPSNFRRGVTSDRATSRRFTGLPVICPARSAQ